MSEEARDIMSILAPLHGLVLAGGRSERMRRDKAALTYHGQSQLEWTMALVSRHVERAFVSARGDQLNDPLRSRYPMIEDTIPDAGPIAGILAAQAAHPTVAWLVLACDLPFLDDGTLTALCAGRDPSRMATAFRSSHDGLPEPLCAIYEPQSGAALLAHLASGRRCPRKFLIQSNACLLEQDRPDALDNINSADEYAATVAVLRPDRS